MVHQTYQLFHLPENYYYLLFVFFSTICSYNFHWYLTPHSVKPSSRLQWAQKHKGYHLAFYFLGLVGCIVLFFPLAKHWSWILFAGFITFLYSAPKLPQHIFKWLKKIAIGKTIFLAVVWTYVTTALPVAIADGAWSTDIILFVLGRFFFVYAICILFDYRDREDDRAEGIKSMITYFNERSINFLFAVSLILSGALTITMLKYGHSILTICIILLPGIIVAALYNRAKKKFSDIFYYFILDGLMMLSALLMLLISI